MKMQIYPPLFLYYKDLNRVIQKPYIEEKDYLGKVVHEDQAAEAWKSYLMRNKSVIVDLFQVIIIILYQYQN